MKLDKEILVKQRFWFLLPLGLVLIFMALGSVWSMRSEAEQKFNEVKRAFDSVQRSATGQVVSEELIKLVQEQRQRAESLKQRLWEELFGLQNQVELEGEVRVIRRPLILWPEHESLREFTVFDFGEPLDRNKFPHEVFRNHFPQLYEQLLSILPLYDEKTGRGAVRANPLAAPGAFAAVGAAKPRGPFGVRPGGADAAASETTTRALMLAVLDPHTFGEGTLTTDEVWTALEDAAVKRELLVALAGILDHFATLQPEFHPVTESELDERKPQEKPLVKPEKTIPPSPAIPVKAKPQDNSAGGSEAAKPPAGPGGQTPTAVGPDRPAKPEGKPTGPTASAAKPQRQLLVRQQFYNTVWYAETLGELKDANQPLPVLGREEGWLLEVRITADAAPDNQKSADKQPAGKSSPAEYYLEITSQNYSPRFEIPKMPLRVWIETVQGQRFFVDVPDAGSVPKAAPAGSGKPAAGRPADQVPIAQQPAKREVEPVRFRLPTPATKPADKKPDAADEPNFVLGVQRQPPAGSLDYHRLANPHWLMDVELRRAKDGAGYQLSGQLYNRSGRRQMPPPFQFVISDGSSELEREIRPVKKPIDSYQSEKFDQTLLLALQAQHVVGVKQVLDWQTTPIKRLDVIRTGEAALAQADRIWTARLQFYPFLQKKRPDQQDVLGYSDPILRYSGGAPAAAGGAPAVPGFKPGAGSGPAADAGPGFGQPREGGETSRNGIPLRRYFPQNPGEARDMPEALPEVRRLPVALVLIADHTALSDILTALANSRLRIQVTQAIWVRTPPLGPPPPPPGSKPGAVIGPAPEASTGAAAADVPGSEAAEVNLIELQIYGLASLYENPYRREEFQQARGGGAPFGPRLGSSEGGRPSQWRPFGGDSRGRGAPFEGGPRRGFRGRR